MKGTKQQLVNKLGYTSPRWKCSLRVVGLSSLGLVVGVTVMTTPTDARVPPGENENVVSLLGAFWGL